MTLTLVHNHYVDIILSNTLHFAIWRFTLSCMPSCRLGSIALGFTNAFYCLYNGDDNMAHLANSFAMAITQRSWNLLWLKSVSRQTNCTLKHCLRKSPWLESIGACKVMNIINLLTRHLLRYAGKQEYVCCDIPLLDGICQFSIHHHCFHYHATNHHRGSLDQVIT